MWRGSRHRRPGVAALLACVVAAACVAVVGATGAATADTQRASRVHGGGMHRHLRQGVLAPDGGGAGGRRRDASGSDTSRGRRGARNGNGEASRGGEGRGSGSGSAPGNTAVTAELVDGGGHRLQVTAACNGKGDGCDHRLVRVNVTSDAAGTSAAAANALSSTTLSSTVAVTHGSSVVVTVADLRTLLHPGSVVQLDGNLACEVDGAMTATGFTLSRPYPWASNKDASVAVTNLARVPGVTATPTVGATHLRLTGQALQQVLPGDVLFVEGAGPLVVSGVTPTSGGVTAQLMAPYPATPGPPAGGPVPLRAFKVLAGVDTSADASHGDDAESVIDRIAAQANSLYAASASFGGVLGMALPGTFAVEFQQPLMRPSVDLRAYLSAGSVLRVGGRMPYVVAPDPPLSATHLYATAAWTGPSAPAVQAELLPYSQLPGAVSVAHGSPHVSTSLDLRAMLEPRDVVMIDNVPGLVVAQSPPPTSSAFSLTKPYPGPTATNVPIFHTGMTALSGTATVAHQASTAETSVDLRPHLRLHDILVFSHAGSVQASVATVAPDAFTSSALPLAAPYAGPTGRDVKVFRTGARLMPGTVSVSANSPAVTSTADLRPHLLPGDVVRVANFPETVVAGGEFGSAPGVSGGKARVTARGFQLTSRWAWASGGGLQLVATGFRRLPAMVSVARDAVDGETSSDVSDYVRPGAAVRIASLRRLRVAKRSASGGAAVTARGVVLASAFPIASVTRVPLYLNTGAGGGAAYDGELVFEGPMGYVDPVHGSPFMAATTDMSGKLWAGDHLRVDGHRDLVLAEGVTPKSLRITLPYPGTTAKRKAVYRMIRRVKLSGTVSVTNQDARAVTSQDLRPELTVGHMVEIERLKFVVVSPMTDKLFTLSEPFGGPSASGVFAYRLLTGSGAGLLMPGTVSVTHGEAVATTSEDLSASISAGDLLRVGLREVRAKEPINRNGFTMDEAWGGTTARGLRAYNLGKSKREVSLEELAAMKLRCRSIYCLAKIEDLERAIPTVFSRSLNAGQSALKALERDGAKKVGADKFGKSDGVDPEVEKEWQRWYRKAKAKLGSGVTEAHASSGAKDRVKTLYAKGSP